jgi:ABC-2 type transport system permease protein
MGVFFMIVMKDPEFARRIGILRTKAQLLAGSADWPTFFGLLAQATAVGGILVFALIGSWVFGREFVDRTAKDLLALPTPRSSIVAAKFTVIALWIMGLVLMVYVLGLFLGWMIVLPRWSIQVAMQSMTTMAMVGLLCVALVTPIALIASVGRGYLAPMGFAIVVLVLAQVLAALGFGPVFPWSIPALLAGLGESPETGLGATSYCIVMFTGLVGLLGTFAWWKYADHTR